MKHSLTLNDYLEEYRLQSMTAYEISNEEQLEAHNMRQVLYKKLAKLRKRKNNTESNICSNLQRSQNEQEHQGNLKR